MSLHGAALQSLRYNPHAKGSEETKFGYVVFDGSPVDYHHWRFRTKLKVDASSKDDMTLNGMMPSERTTTLVKSGMRTMAKAKAQLNSHIL